jgi:nitrite reductase (NO-forming)
VLKTLTESSIIRRSPDAPISGGTVLAFITLLLAGGCEVPDTERASRTGGMVWGTPEAEVFEEEYAGPPAVGSTLTLAPRLAPLEAGNRTHEVRLDVVKQEVEVASRVRYEAWTFAGSVPGPVLHVREGDRVIFTMKNRSNEAVRVTEPGSGAAPFLSQLAEDNYHKATPATMPMVHSMDFHSGTVAADDKWRNIAPGQTIRFEWVANYPGVYLYHCGTPSVLQHMSMGQYGAVVVSPRNGFPTDELVDREYVIVQSEFYLTQGDDGTYVYDMDAAQARNPSIVAFNGHQDRHMADPLDAVEGERVRLYLLNVGPNDTSSFHVIGAIFDRVWYEGNVENEWRGMQAVLLGASNGAVVEFIIPEAGEYVMVDHEMVDAEKGAKGVIQARPRMVP